MSSTDISIPNTAVSCLRLSAYKAVPIATIPSPITRFRRTLDAHPKSFTYSRFQEYNPILLLFCLGTVSNALYYLVHSLSPLYSTSRSKLNGLRIWCWGVSTLRLKVNVPDVTECIISQTLTANKLAESFFLHGLKPRGFQTLGGF